MTETRDPGQLWNYFRWRKHPLSYQGRRLTFHPLPKIKGLKVLVNQCGFTYDEAKRYLSLPGKWRSHMLQLFRLLALNENDEWRNTEVTIESLITSVASAMKRFTPLSGISTADVTLMLRVIYARWQLTHQLAQLPAYGYESLVLPLGEHYVHMEIYVTVPVLHPEGGTGWQYGGVFVDVIDPALITLAALSQHDRRLAWKGLAKNSDRYTYATHAYSWNDYQRMGGFDEWLKRAMSAYIPLEDFFLPLKDWYSNTLFDSLGTLERCNERIVWKAQTKNGYSIRRDRLELLLNALAKLQRDSNPTATHELQFTVKFDPFSVAWEEVPINK